MVNAWREGGGRREGWTFNVTQPAYTIQAEFELCIFESEFECTNTKQKW